MLQNHEPKKLYVENLFIFHGGNSLLNSFSIVHAKKKTPEQRYWFIDTDGLTVSDVRERLTDFELDCQLAKRRTKLRENGARNAILSTVVRQKDEF